MRMEIIMQISKSMRIEYASFPKTPFSLEWGKKYYLSLYGPHNMSHKKYSSTCPSLYGTTTKRVSAHMGTGPTLGGSKFQIQGKQRGGVEQNRVKNLEFSCFVAVLLTNIPLFEGGKEYQIWKPKGGGRNPLYPSPPYPSP